MSGIIEETHPSQDKFASYSFLGQVSPFKQSLIVFSVSFFAIVSLGLMSANEEIEWFIAIASMGFYTWMNLVFYFFTQQNALSYIGQSVLLFILKFLLLLGTAYFISATSIFDIPEYQIMIVATLIFYLVGTIAVSIMRQVVLLLGINEE